MISIKAIIFSNYKIYEVYRSHPWRHGYPLDIRQITGGYPPSGLRVPEAVLFLFAELDNVVTISDYQHYCIIYSNNTGYIVSKFQKKFSFLQNKTLDDAHKIKRQGKVLRWGRSEREREFGRSVSRNKRTIRSCLIN